MNRFNLVLVLVFSLMFGPVASAQSYLVTENAPVYPGVMTYVYVPIQNMGFSDANALENVVVKIAPKDNASANAVTILNNVDSLGTINTWGDQRTAKFRIYVNPDAIEGDYYFNVFVTYNNLITDSTQTPMRETTKLEDQILTIKGIPMIMILNSSLDTVAPTSKNTETLTFKNSGTGTVENAVVEINLAGTNSIFSILGAGKRFSLGTLKAGDVASITFDLAVDITAAPGVYNIPVHISGQNNFSNDNVMGLVVAGMTNFDISYVESLGSFSLNVVNVGISTANAVAVNLPRQKNFSITGATSQVIGNLNPGDYTSANFQITKTPGGGNDLDVEILYTDTSGQRHTVTKSLTVALASTGTQSGRATTGTNYTLWAVVAVIIIVLYWQRKTITTYFQKPKGK